MSLDGPRLAPLPGPAPKALVVLIHGTENDVLLFRSMGLATTALAAVGIDLETHVSPGTGHSVGQDGFTAATEFAIRVLT